MINILYTDSGCCDHSPEVISILEDIVGLRLKDESRKLLRIDRWNIYQPHSLHIVYIVEMVQYVTEEKRLVSAELVCPLSEFTSRWREYKLDKLGI